MTKINNMPYSETPFYSTEQNCQVYHNHTDCTEGNNIEKKYLQFGTGGKRLCAHCERLSNKEGVSKNLTDRFNGLGLAAGILGGEFKSSLFAAMKKLPAKK